MTIIFTAVFQCWQLEKKIILPNEVKKLDMSVVLLSVLNVWSTQADSISHIGTVLIGLGRTIGMFASNLPGFYFELPDDLSILADYQF